MWRPFVQGVNIMIYTGPGCLPQEFCHFNVFHFVLRESQKPVFAQTGHASLLHLDGVWWITMLPMLYFCIFPEKHTQFSFLWLHYFVVSVYNCTNCQKLQLHLIVVYVTLCDFHNQPCTETIWFKKCLKKNKTHTSKHAKICIICITVQHWGWRDVILMPLLGIRLPTETPINAYIMVHMVHIHYNSNYS